MSGVVIMPNWQAFNVIEQSDRQGLASSSFEASIPTVGKRKLTTFWRFAEPTGGDGQDWLANIQLGRNQWQDAMDDVSDALQNSNQC